jgi:DNA-binding transcriptional ArsR family regulator
MPGAKKEFSDAALQMIADRFKMLAEPMRLKILHALWDGELTVGDIIGVTGALQANISKHLGILQQAGLVSRRKDGLNVYYQVCDETVFELCEAVCTGLHGRLTAQIGELPPALLERKRA